MAYRKTSAITAVSDVEGEKKTNAVPVEIQHRRMETSTSSSSSSSTSVYAQIVDLLVAGGYFRARLPNMKPFDVILGGLVWSLTAIGGFDETATTTSTGMSYSSSGAYSDLNVGMRLRLAEAIEASFISLPSKALMIGKAPTIIRAHQITGETRKCDKRERESNDKLINVFSIVIIISKITVFRSSKESEHRQQEESLIKMINYVCVCKSFFFTERA